MVEHAFKENIAHLLSLWHCYGSVVKSNGLYIHEKWPNKVWGNEQVIDESQSTFNTNRADTPDGKKYVTFKSTQPNDDVSSLVAMNKSLMSSQHITEDSSIREVTNELELRHWVTLGSQGFGYDIELASVEHAFLDARSTFYFIEHHAEPLGTVMTWHEENDIGIHQMTVVQKGRGKGLAARALAQIERQAHEVQAQTLSLQASRKGLNIYKRAGFNSLGYISSYL
ncbi:GNAT family N-acetyltransferase [Pseudoalteromonas citrea]|nr:GNAT family N-acetyltransferase [Pseudoalteromonas citrea]